MAPSPSPATNVPAVRPTATHLRTPIAAKDNQASSPKPHPNGSAPPRAAAKTARAPAATTSLVR